MKFNILSILPDNTFLVLDSDLHRELFEKERPINLAKKYKVSLKNMSRYKNKSRALPFGLFMKLIENNNIDMCSLQNKINIKIGRNGDFINIGPILNINSKWVYISELIKGDGHIPSNFWYITFTNKEISLINEMKIFFLSLGLSEKSISIYKKEEIYTIVIRTYLIAYILYKILGVLPGNKSKDIDIKEFVINDTEFRKAAVRGAFDAEGSVSFTGSRRISISSNSINWIQKLKLILDNEKIKSTIFKEKNKRKNTIYRLLIHGIINIKRFGEQINPIHEKRKDKIKEIIDSYWKNPECVFHKNILLAINNGINKKREIANKLKISLMTTANNIAVLKRKEYITPKEKIQLGKAYFFRYELTKKGQEYLEKELLPFFD